MPDIGIRELKTRASEIIQNVWKRRARYTITYRGRAVGLLLPLETAAPSGIEAVASPSADAWTELARLGASMAKRWPKGKSSADILSKMRK
jgi:antitoxin (DNA-binding transcriptional repressor) of toxin-antitoxin stability system